MELCELCRKLKISLSAFISHPGMDDNPRLRDPIRSLGRLDELRTRYKTCPFCRLIFAAFKSGPTRNISQLTDLNKVAVFATWINCFGPSREERIRSPTLSILVWAEAPRILPTTYKIVVRAASEIIPDQPHFGRISPVRTSLLDFNQLKRWLKHCNQNHKGCQEISRPSKPTSHFLVIDVRSRCIVHAPEHCRYFVLSYIWGQARQFKLSEDNFDAFKRENSLQPRYLTATIRDAIELTEKLGERYLWVDSLCIVQDNDAIRQQTLQNMDRIYADSLLTLVAGTSAGADDPLPGVTEPRTWIQWYQRVSPALTLSAPFDYKDFLEHARYSERAWT